MSQIIFSVLFLFNSHYVFAVETRQSIKELFDHKKHKDSFKSTGIACVDCHQFSVKSPSFDPLAKNVGAGYLKVNRMVCHECHLGKVQVARVNQCSLCHLHPEKLAPPSHKLNWKKRHGNQAQMDPDSCNGCHQENQNSCNNCHTQRNTLKPMVHRPNFRLTHGIEARSNPASCVTCHTNTNSCIQCHKAGLSR